MIVEIETAEIKTEEIEEIPALLCLLRFFYVSVFKKGFLGQSVLNWHRLNWCVMSYEPIAYFKKVHN